MHPSGLLLCAGLSLAAQQPAPAQTPPAQSPSPAGIAAGAVAGLPSVATGPTDCLASGDGYLRARLRGAIEAEIDWPNSGTRCQGETKDHPPGVRLSFQRAAGAAPDLLFVFGVTGTREGRDARAAGVNLTVIVQGTERIFGTLGDSRCTVDTLSQRPAKAPHTYRVEARGFCTQPAHAVRGDGDVLVSTFDFAGPVRYPDTPPLTTSRSSRP